MSDKYNFFIDNKIIYFPLKYTPRQEQLKSLEFLKKSIQSNNKFFALNLGVGLGKSYLMIMFMNWYRNFINSASKFDIITGSKILQQQYINDFDFIKNYKGRNNYWCDKFSTDCSIGAELHKVFKNNCDNCPYEKAKNQWITSDIGILNFSLFSTITLFQHKIIEQRNSNVLIIDECHLFESTFANYLDSKVSTKTLKKCGFKPTEIEKYDDRYISKIETLEKYLEFLEKKLIPELNIKLDLFDEKLKNCSIKERQEVGSYIDNINSKLLSFKKLFESYNLDPNNIVLDISENKNDKMYSGKELISQHIWVNNYLNDIIWKNYDHIIFMSGTILNPEVFCYQNGLDPSITAYFEMESPFDIKNRPIYYLKIGKMSINNKEETFKKQIPWIEKILKKYKNEKGIIHCATYEISNWVKENIQDERLLFHDPDNRDEILEKHLTSLEPTVIVSPSMITGVDLKDNSARFSIILKILYPNLGSKKVQARKASNKEYYINETISNLIQMSGRSVRNENDYCDTFILDSNFSDLLKYNYNKIPKYFTDAIKTLKL